MMTNHWILVVTEQRIGRTILGAMDILQNRIRNRFWAFGQRAKGMRLLGKGDRAIIYASGRTGKDFVGFCEITSAPYELSKKRREMMIGNPSYAVDIDRIVYWLWRERTPLFSVPGPWLPFQTYLLKSLFFLEN